MGSADQPRHNIRVDAADVRPPTSPEQSNLRPLPVGPGQARSTTHRLPEPPPITVPLCEQVRIERIPLTDEAHAQDGASGEHEQDYAVVMHVLQPVVASGPGTVQQGPVNPTDRSAEYRALTGDAAERDIGFDDNTVVVR